MRISSLPELNQRKYILFLLWCSALANLDLKNLFSVFRLYGTNIKHSMYTNFSLHQAARASLSLVTGLISLKLTTVTFPKLSPDPDLVDNQARMK